MSGDLDDFLDRLGRAQPRITVVGDAMLDRWVRGGVTRISREAPVPVVEVDEDAPEECAGGAANTAMNLAALGARVRLIAAVADDAAGRRLLEILEEGGVDTSQVAVSDRGTTPSKTRILGGDQLVVRIDQGVRPRFSEAALASVDAALAAHDPDTVLVVCDYGAGLLDRAADVLMRSPRPRAMIVDAHDLRRWASIRPDIVTPNCREAELLLGRALPDPGRPDAVGHAAGELLEAAGAATAVVTLDREGTVVLEAGRTTARTYARLAPERQASGAGDTFTAALAAGVAVGVPLPAAARLAQRAADVVTGRDGTSVCSAADLRAAGIGGTSSPVAMAELREALRAERGHGRKVVFTNGCFDVLHLGHTRHLRQAKELGDVLVVAVNDDASVRRLKGSGRPVNPIEDRVALIESLGFVDHVIVFSEDRPVALLAELRPEIYAKGGDYTPEMLEETDVVRGYGGEVRILDYLPAHSTTHIVERIVTGSIPR